MSLESLFERLKSEGSVTPATPSYTTEVTPKPAPIAARTPVTPVTRKSSIVHGDWEAAFQERAAILEYDAGLSREEAERQAKQITDAERIGYWSDEEFDAATRRTAQFVRRGVPERLADMIACRLVQRDRLQDDRRSCAECRAFRVGGCTRGTQPVAGGGVEVLHRCTSFVDQDAQLLSSCSQIHTNTNSNGAIRHN